MAKHLTVYEAEDKECQTGDVKIWNVITRHK